jgi:hypothetical protein
LHQESRRRDDREQAAKERIMISPQVLFSIWLLGWREWLTDWHIYILLYTVIVVGLLILCYKYAPPVECSSEEPPVEFTEEELASLYALKRRVEQEEVQP